MPEEKILYINFFAGINGVSVTKLIRAIHKGMQKNINKIYLVISSPGGDVAAGVSAYNFLKGLSGVKIITHNYGVGHSMAVVLFCAGEERYSAQNSQFLLHSINSGVQGDERAIKAQLQATENYRDIIASIIAENCRTAKERVKEIMFEGTTWNAQQAKDYGLVHEIKEELPASPNMVLITDDLPKSSAPQMQG